MTRPLFCRLGLHRVVVGGGWERKQPWLFCDRCHKWFGYVDEPRSASGGAQ